MYLNIHIRMHIHTYIYIYKIFVKFMKEGISSFKKLLYVNDVWNFHILLFNYVVNYDKQ